LDYDAMSKVIKFISIADASHPWTVMRAAELLNWINSGEYNKFNLGETTRLIVDECPKVITQSSDQKIRKNKYLNQ
jgi:hypothetical protein